jgi:GH25 family lysozyme M1 (1,4-beta-N-acetylmuramidase)
MNILAKGVDVSAWQKEIDWDKVKASGINFAILRCGYGSDIKSQDDKYFERNITECERIGMPYGVYLYSYANSVEKAKSEAEHTIRLIQGHTLSYPVFYDLEDADTTSKCSKDLILEIAKTYVETLEAKGYCVGIYANKYWNTTYLTDSWYNTKPRWIAQYNSECTYSGEYGIWQYSSSGKVDGIDGNVDMNYAYVDYPSTINKKPVAKKTNGDIAKEVIKGLWGNGEERKKRLTKAGYNYADVQNIVNNLVGKKSNEEVAEEVLNGLWSNGKERKNRLTTAGYDYNAVQKIVNEKISKSELKSLDKVAKEVIRGEWGNGQTRVNKLTAAGYDAVAVQKKVNEIL